MRQLFLGALKSAVSSICGLILALPMVDPTKFSFSSLGGWYHIAEVSLAVIVISEARFFKQWSDAVTSNGDGK